MTSIMPPGPTRQDPLAHDEAPATQDALATALDRLVALVERQEAQIRALQAIIEEML